MFTFVTPVSKKPSKRFQNYSWRHNYIDERKFSPMFARSRISSIRIRKKPVVFDRSGDLRWPMEISSLFYLYCLLKKKIPCFMRFFGNTLARSSALWQNNKCISANSASPVFLLFSFRKKKLDFFLFLEIWQWKSSYSSQRRYNENNQWIVQQNEIIVPRIVTLSMSEFIRIRQISGNICLSNFRRTRTSLCK